MSVRRRNTYGLDDLAEETSQITQNVASSGGRGSILGGLLTGLASTVALIFSAVSLYHSVLKQPELHVFASPVMHYTRDGNGDREVFAVPVTIANHGARDGVVLDMELEVEDPVTGTTKTFYSAYTVDGEYFVKPAAYDMQARRFDRVDRPQTPFAPVSVAGRSNFSGTILFYSKGDWFPKVISKKGNFDLTLKVRTRLDDSLGFIDEFLRTEPEPVRRRVKITYVSPNALQRGATQPLIDIDWSEGRERTNE